MIRWFYWPIIVIGLGFHSPNSRADDFALHEFKTARLTETYYSEGANFGDFNNDGETDIVYGPFWFEGPAFETKHEIYKPLAQNRQGYADHFFAWPHDFDGDGNLDIFVVGFPGTPAYVYQNPGNDQLDQHWPKHEVFDWVSNESPQLIDIVGDPRPELVCARDGRFVYATIDWEKPFEKWTCHEISEKVTSSRFGHGLGVGDINGDGRQDFIAKTGWFEQPESLDDDPKWNFRAAEFAGPGGAEMYAYDVDGDGDNDVITSIAAHDFGLAWHEQVKQDGKIAFVKHLIMGRRPDENKYGVVFSELHSLNLIDIDGDGLKDIVTGKTFWSHHMKSEMWDAGAVVYWFQLVRNDDGIDWVPHKIGDDSGIGRQLTIGDVNRDGLPDIVVGGMKGCHILTHSKVVVDESTWRSQQPKPTVELKSGLAPEAAAQHMTTLDGFNLTLAAGEPQVHQPIGFTIDERGRLWVAEAYTYPIRAADGQGKDKIVILEDTNHDGTLDSRKIFAEGLNLVSGIEVGMGGVWIGAAPYLMFIPDKNGDDIPDGKPEILLDGFGFEDTHETLNSFVWGPDGWLYGCHGVFTHSLVGKPGTPKEDRVGLNAGVWRFHPTRHEFEVFAWGTSNPWGVDFNDTGQTFITACVIPHLWHMIQGGRYQRQGGRHFNPYVFDDIKTIADHQHYVGNIRDHAWWGDKPQAPATTLAAGGGHAHAGAMIYLGDNWPKQFRNRIFMNNIHGNRVNVDILKRSGSGFVGHHGDDILLANDQWYRGISLKYGPNGSVYLIDWYDKNACHRVDPTIWDRTNGRVYNLAYGEPEPAKVDLETMSDAELVQFQLHENDWYVRMARRILQHRSSLGNLDAEAHSRLGIMFQRQTDINRKLRALWALHVTDGLTEKFRLELLDHPHEMIRAWAIQLELENHTASTAFLAKMNQMASSETSPVVRLYLASAAGRLANSDRWPLVEALAHHGEDASDHNLPLMIWYATEPLVTQDPTRALRLAADANIPLLRQFIVRRAASDPKSMEHVVAALVATNDQATQIAYLDEMLRAFQGRANIPVPPQWEKAYVKLSASENHAVVENADKIAVVLGDIRVFPKFRKILADNQATHDKRKQAMDILIQSRDPDSATTFQSVLDQKELRGPAIRALSQLADPKTPAAILAIYSQLSDSEKRDAISTLVSRPTYAHDLLDAIRDHHVPGTDLHAFNVRQLSQFKNKSLDQRITEVWGKVRETSSDKKSTIAEYRSRLGAKVLAQADTANGRRVFDATCASCHVLFGEGGKVGPDITGSNRANLDYILENLLDPSAVLGKEYRMSVILMLDGRVVSGLIQLETDSAITLRTINDTVVIAKDDIDEQKLSDLSVMPEGQLDQLKSDEVRDLIAYLAVPAQVLPRGPLSKIDPATSRVKNAIEGEKMKVIGKSSGNVQTQPMGQFSKDRWSGNSQLFWTGSKPGGILQLEIEIAKPGIYDVDIVMTKARDYGIVQLALDGKKLGSPVDLFNTPDVITTGMLTFPGIQLDKGVHTLSIEIVDANPKSVKAFLFGLDYVRAIVQ